MNNITGGMTYDEFVSSLNGIMDNITGGVVLDELVNSYNGFPGAGIKRDFDISDICTAEKNAKSLSSCVSSIEKILVHLSNPDKHVRKFAAKVVVGIVEKATEFLMEESNPELIVETGFRLIHLINKLKTCSDIVQNNITMQKLKQAEKRIWLKIQTVYDVDNDRFIFCSNNLFKNFSIDDKHQFSDNFFDSLNKTIYKI